MNEATNNYTIPATMQAVVLSGTGMESVACREVPVPQPGPRQLLCRVDAAGVCTSILKILAQGKDHNYFNGWDPAKWPVILGDEGALTVVQVGIELRDQYQPGQRFGIQPLVDSPPINHRERYANQAEGMAKCAVGYTLGGNLAQYLLVTEEVLEHDCLLPLPRPDLPYFAVSMGEPISCVCSAQERQFHLFKEGPFSPRVPKLGMLPGGTTVVIGAGAMGRMHVEMAMRFRPAHLVVCDTIPARLERVRQTMGRRAAELGINLLPVLSDALPATVREVSGGQGADDIILAVGIQPVQQAALELLARGGVANLFGGLPRGKHLLQLDAIKVHYQEIKVVGSSGGEPSDLATALQAISNGDVDAGNYVFGIGGLQHVPTVLGMIERNEVDGKVIVYPHLHIPELRPVEHWDQQQETDLLRSQGFSKRVA